MAAWKILFGILAVSVRYSIQDPNEKRLLHHLLDKYNTLERPVNNASEPIMVKFGATLMQIIDVCEASQILTTNTWLHKEWVDTNLVWNASEFGNLTDIRIHPNRVWKPDILMYNSADMGFDSTFHTNLVVKSNGSVFYIPPGIFKSTCKIDLSLYPYEEHKCEMKFGSWTYDGHQLDFELHSEMGGDLTSFITNSEWEVLEMPVKKNTVYYSCCAEPFVDVTFTIHLRRRGAEVVKTLMIPFILIATVSLSGFLLSVNSKAKLFLNVAAIFSIVFKINTIKTDLPVALTHVPFFCKYFSALIIIVLLSTISAITILNFIDNSKKGCDIPQWIRAAFLKYIPGILFMSYQPLEKIESRNAGCELDQQSLLNPNSELSVICNEIKMITDKLRKDELQDELAQDWIFAANVLNRLSLLILSIVTLIITISFLV